MRLHRLLGIIMLIDSRGTMKAKDLARILEASERTIYRDIDILCESGIPIFSIPGPNGGYSFMEDYKINSNVLEGKDAVNLLLSTMGIQPERNSEMARQLQNAIIKLENSVPEEHKEEIIRAKERFFIDSDPWWGKRMPHKDIDIIKNAVLDLKKLRIHYRKYAGEVTERVIRPYGAIVKNLEWYLAAFCELKEEMRVFKCGRIEVIEVLDEGFNMADDFYLEEFWNYSKQQFVRHTALKESFVAFSVKIRCFEEVDNILKGFSVLSAIKKAGYWVYELDMISLQTACSVLFPLSDRIEILEPVSLKNHVIKKCNRILNLYKTNIKP